MFWNNKVEEILRREAGHSTPLDHQARPCLGKDAVLISTASALKFAQGQAEEKTISAYKTSQLVEAETYSEQREIHPIGRGQFEGDIKTIGNYPFSWADNGNWVYVTKHCQVQVNPHSDNADVEYWLETFQEIEAKIINKGAAGKPISFELGGKAYPAKSGNEKSVAIAQAIDKFRIIKFPFAKDGGHIIGTCLAKATAATKEPISLQGIILHEVGHLIEELLTKQRTSLQIRLQEKLPDILEALTIISPHYLAIETPKIIASLKSSSSEEFITEKILVTGNELFAEMARHFYLEPIMTCSMPASPKTGWKGFDDLAWTLQREARFTLRKDKAGKPIFSNNRSKPSLFPETIQDFLFP